MASSVEGCEELMRVLAPGIRAGRARVARGARGRGRVARPGRAARARAGCGGCGALPAPAREIELPLAPANRADFMREVADVHRALFPGNEELYGDNVRGKIERCLRVSDADAAAAERERAEYRERFAEAVGELDLLVTPTVPFVAPPADVDELEIRGAATRSRIRSAPSAGRRSRFPCGPAEDGLPASVQLAAPVGRRRAGPCRRPPARALGLLRRPVFPCNRLLLGGRGSAGAGLSGG